MRESTKSFWKGFVRMIEFALLILLILVIMELLLTYKEAHDHPERYAAGSGERGTAGREGGANGDPMQEAAPVMARNPERQPGAGGAQPARRAPARGGAAPRARRQDGAAASDDNLGTGSQSPGLLTFSRTRGRFVTLFTGAGSATSTNQTTNSTSQATNAPAGSAGTNTASNATAEEPAGDGRIGYLAPQFVRPGRRGAGSTNSFRFAVP